MSTLRDHLFVSDTDGGLYDTRKQDWSNKKPLREVFQRTYSRITNTHELRATLRNGQYAWPGGYPMFFISSDGGAFHFDCVKKNLREISDAIRDNSRNGWNVQVEINYEDANLYCDQCSQRIESAYAEDQDDTTLYTEEQHLRTVTMRPYADQSISFTLTTYDTNRMNENKSVIGYVFTQNDKVLFKGEDFSCSPLHGIDSDECLRALLSFLTLRPGDTDREYFDNYTEEQKAFASEHAEILSMYAMDDDPTPFDETDQDDDDQDDDDQDDDDQDDDDQDDDDQDEDRIEEDDITTEDHLVFYQNGKVFAEFTNEDETKERNAYLRWKMDQDQFWPNVWFISDHGNVSHYDIGPGPTELLVEDYEVVSHGYDGDQYFQGCGVSFTRFDYVVTGIGNSEKEAFEDCLDQLVMQGYTLGPDLLKEGNDKDETTDDTVYCPRCGNADHVVETAPSHHTEYNCTVCDEGFDLDETSATDTHFYLSVRVLTDYNTDYKAYELIQDVLKTRTDKHYDQVNTTDETRILRRVSSYFTRTYNF